MRKGELLRVKVEHMSINRSNFQQEELLRSVDSVRLNPCGKIPDCLASLAVELSVLGEYVQELSRTFGILK